MVSFSNALDWNAVKFFWTVFFFKKKVVVVPLNDKADSFQHNKVKN